MGNERRENFYEANNETIRNLILPEYCQPNSDGEGLAVFYQQRFQRGRNTTAERFHAAALPRGGSSRTFAPVRGSVGEWGQ